MATEKKAMYMVWTLEVGSACPVTAYLENGKVVTYYDDDEFCKPLPHQKFFDTKEEADMFIIDRINELENKMQEICDILSEVDYWEDGYGERHEAPTLNDFIPKSVMDKYRREYDAEKLPIVDGLVRCARDRIIEVAGRTIPMVSVSHIEWHDQEPTVILHCGIRISVSDYTECRLLKIIYGYSGRIGKRDSRQRRNV